MIGESEERKQQLQEKHQQLKQNGEQQQQKQKQQKQRKEKQITDDDEDTVITKITQKSSLEDEELECNLIYDKDDKYDNNFVIIPTTVLFRMKQNLNWKCKRSESKSSRKISAVGK